MTEIQKDNKNIANVPHLRFPGFTGEWEVKKLGDVCEIKTGKKDTKNKEDDGEYPFFVRSNTVERINSYSYDGEAILTSGDGVGVGKNFHYINGKFDFHQRVYSLRKFKNGYIGKYIYYLFSDRFYDRVTRLSAKNSVDSVRMDMISGMQVYFPLSTEQTKISSFLSLIDERIQTQIKIIEQLKTLIKGLSEKLFSQEIRFKGFTEKWAVKKLGEIFYSEKGRGLSKDKLVSNGQYECVLYGELYTKYNEVIFDVVSKTNEEAGLKSKIGDLLIPSSTTTTGIDLANVTAINKENVLLGGDITILRSEEKINNIFYAYYLSNYKKEEIASYAQGSTIVHLYYNHIKNMLIDLPSFEEQTVIANFLSAIDTKIQTEKNTLDKYQTQKQYLLQNLFI